MTLFPKMDTDTADKDDKPDNTNTQDDAGQKQDEEFKVMQLFRDIIARFSSDDDKKDEGEVSKEEETTTADESFSLDGLPPRMNSPVPMYGGTIGDQHALAMPQENANTGQDDTIINSADDGSVSLVCIILNASIMQLIFGIICISLGIAAIVIKIPAYHIGDPIWTGFLFYVVTGLLGVLTWRFPKDGLVVSYLVMSILSAFASLQLMAIVAFAMRMENYFEDQSGVSTEQSFRYKLYIHQIEASNQDGFSKSERLALEILIFFVAFIEMVFVIIMSIVTCKLWPRKTTRKQKDDTAIADDKNDFDLKSDTSEKPPAFNY